MRAKIDLSDVEYINTMTRRLLAKGRRDRRGCLIWTGKRNRAGYGLLSVGPACNRKMMKAHRLMWAVVNGRDPGSALICHTCDVKSCIEPSHLYAGTMSDNVKDSYARNQNRKRPNLRGERNGHAHLTRAQALYVFRRKESQRALARRFGVTRGCIQNIQAGRSWRWLTNALTQKS